MASIIEKYNHRIRQWVQWHAFCLPYIRLSMVACVWIAKDTGPQLLNCQTQSPLVGWLSFSWGKEVLSIRRFGAGGDSHPFRLLLHCTYVQCAMWFYRIIPYAIIIIITQWLVGWLGVKANRAFASAKKCTVPLWLKIYLLHVCHRSLISWCNLSQSALEMFYASRKGR